MTSNGPKLGINLNSNISSLRSHFKALFTHTVYAVLIFQLGFPQFASVAIAAPPPNEYADGGDESAQKKDSDQPGQPPAEDLALAGSVSFADVADAGRVRVQAQQINSLLDRLKQADYRAVEGDSSALLDVEQLREDYEPNGDQDHVVARYAITGKGINVSRPRVDFFPQEIRIHYDPQTERLEFQRWVYDNSLKRARKANAHIFKGVKLTGPVGKCVTRDRNVTLLSTDRGVLGGFSPVVMGSLFNGWVPFTTWYPAASILHADAKIESLELLTPESTPQPLTSVEGERVDAYAVHDLAIRIRMGGQAETLHFSYRKDVLNGRLRTYLLTVLLLLQSANPKLELLGPISAILANERKRRGELDALNQNLADAVAASPENLEMAALRNTAHVLDFSKLASLLAPDQKDDEKRNAFDKALTEDSVEWTADDWVRLNSIIRASRVAEEEEATRLGVPLERLRRSWGEVLAANIRNPTESVASRVKIIAEKKASASTSFTGDLCNLAKSQLTPARLILLGSAVAGDVANQLTDGGLTRGLFTLANNVLGVATKIPGVSSVIEETQKYSGNYFEPYAFTSIALLLGVVLTFQPISYVIAKTIALIRDERNEDGSRWTAAQAFFSYGGRMYATFTYPFQLLVWRLGGQRNITAALRNGGGLMTPGALHTPYSEGSQERALDKMNQHLESDAVRRERAMLIAAIAVNQVLKQKGAPADPATLMMMMAAHEEGKLTEFINMLSVDSPEGSPDVAWHDLATKVHGQLIKLKDGGVGPVDADTVNHYAKVMQRAVKTFGKMNNPDKGFTACVANGVTRSCQWVGRKAKAFATWGSSLAGTLLTGGVGFRFYERNKSFVASESDTTIADHQYRYDYAGSEWMTAGLDSQRFPVALQISKHFDKVLASLADAGEQCLIYGAQGGVEQNMISGGIGERLSNPSPPLATLANRRDHLPYVPFGEVPDDYELGTGKQASVAQSLYATGAALGDPEAGFAGIMHTQQRRMDATANALQGKGLMGYIPRTIAMVLISVVTAAQSAAGISSWSGTDVGTNAMGSLLRQCNVIFNKMSLLYGVGGFAVGYAVIWAYVSWNQNTLKKAVGKQQAILDHVDHLIEQGLRMDRELAWQEGIQGLQGLYMASGVAVDPKFMVPIDQYNQELAREFAQYSRTNSPVATVISTKASLFNNIALGGLVSTVLGIVLSHNMYNPELAIGPQLVASITAFIATYFGAKGLKTILPSVVRGVKAAPGRIAETCGKLVGLYPSAEGSAK